MEQVVRGIVKLNSVCPIIIFLNHYELFTYFGWC